MKLQSRISLLVRLLLAGLLSVAVSGSPPGTRFFQDGISKKTFEPLITRQRKPRQAYETSTVEKVVRGLPKYLHFQSEPPESTEIKLDDSSSLECAALGSPPPAIHWLKDGRKLRLDNDLLSNELDESEFPLHGISLTVSRLFIDCMTPQDRGLYTCVAENHYHRSSRDANVYLSNIPVIFNPSCLAPKSSREFFGKPARIYMWTSYLLQNVGNDAILFCRASGDPPLTLEWIEESKGEKIIPDGEKYNILENGDLQIKHITRNDMTRYTCKVSNLFGENKITTFLYPLAPSKK